MRQAFLISLLLVPMIAWAEGRMVFESPPGRLDRVSGPGHVLVQGGYAEMDPYPGAGRGGPGYGRPAAAKFTCAEWSRQRGERALVFDGDALVGRSAEAVGMTYYVNGALDADKSRFDEKLLKKIDAACDKDGGRKVANVITSWW